MELEWFELWWKKGKRGIKVAIITHSTKIQQIDEFPALLNVGKDNGYSLESQTYHDLCYVYMNWKREMEWIVKNYRAEMGTKV